MQRMLHCCCFFKEYRWCYRKNKNFNYEQCYTSWRLVTWWNIHVLLSTFQFESRFLSLIRQTYDSIELPKTHKMWKHTRSVELGLAVVEEENNNK